MDEEALNVSIRAFLKMVGINSQREIERAVVKALETRAIADRDGPFPVTMTLRCEALGISETFEGDIKLQR